MILVTGPSGHIGKELVPQLLAAGQDVRVLVRDERKVAWLDPCVERAVGDLERPETLAAALRGVEKVFLLTFETRQDVNMLAVAKAAGVRQIVKLSTLEAADRKLQLGRWHRERESLIEASGLEWTFLRPGMFMSNSLDWWGDTIREQGGVYFPGGKGRVAPVDPRDIAAVAAAALTRPGHAGCIHELTGAELLTIREMVETISRVIGQPLRYQNIPPLAARFFMLKSGMDKTLVDALMEVIAALRKGGGEQVTGTVAQVLGRAPRSFEDWCREHADAFRA